MTIAVYPLYKCKKTVVYILLNGDTQ